MSGMVEEKVEFPLLTTPEVLNDSPQADTKQATPDTANTLNIFVISNIAP
jgi:hypothetical protein